MALPIGIQTTRFLLFCKTFLKKEKKVFMKTSETNKKFLQRQFWEFFFFSKKKKFDFLELKFEY